MTEEPEVGVDQPDDENQPDQSLAQRLPASALNVAASLARIRPPELGLTGQQILAANQAAAMMQPIRVAAFDSIARNVGQLATTLNQRWTSVMDPISAGMLAQVSQFDYSRHLSALSAAASLQASTDRWVRSTLWSGELFKNLNELLQGFDPDFIDKLWKAHGPRNWPFGIGSTKVAQSIIQDEGIPIVWVPRKEIVRELFDAADFPARSQIIDTRADDILEDCREVLAEIPSGGRLSRIATGIEEAIGSFLAGFPAPAQSHAANLMDSTLRNMNRHGAAFGVSKFKYKDVVQALPLLDGNILMSDYRGVCVLAAIPKALTEWFPDKGQAVPKEFSRHATSHAADDPDQHCRVNAVISIMLVVSLLREAHESAW